MLTLLLACTTIGPGSATADATHEATLRELDVYAEGTGFYAAASSPGSVIVACEYANGNHRYGPNADPRIEVS